MREENERVEKQYVFAGSDWTELAERWGLDNIPHHNNEPVPVIIEVLNQETLKMESKVLRDKDDILAHYITQHIKSAMGNVGGIPCFVVDYVKEDLHDFLTALIANCTSDEAGIFTAIRDASDYTRVNWFLQNLRSFWN